MQRKSKDKDGYSAVQVGLVEARKTKKVTKPMKGHFDKAGLPPCRVLREFRVEDGAEVKVGDKLSVEQFAAGDKVTVSGISRGQGLPGRRQAPPLPRRRGDARLDVPPRPRLDRRLGLPVARAPRHARAPATWAPTRSPSRTCQVVRVDAGNNLLVVRGSVPGAGGSIVVIRKN